MAPVSSVQWREDEDRCQVEHRLHSSSDRRILPLAKVPVHRMS